VTRGDARTKPKLWLEERAGGPPAFRAGPEVKKKGVLRDEALLKGRTLKDEFHGERGRGGGKSGCQKGYLWDKEIWNRPKRIGIRLKRHWLDDREMWEFSNLYKRGEAAGLRKEGSSLWEREKGKSGT